MDFFWGIKMLSIILKTIFIYIPAIYGYWVFIYLVFVNPVNENEFAIQKTEDEIKIVEIVR